MGHEDVIKRPGGRTADVTARIREAIIDIIVKDGVDTCTFAAVAERAKVERSTLYRRFPDRWDAIIDALMARAAADVMPNLTGSFPDDLRSVLRKLVETLESPLGPAVLAVAAELRAGSGSDYSRAFFDQRMAQLAPMFDAAIGRGELAADVDREALFTFAAGAIYFRTFIAARGVDDDFIASIVGLICWQYCAPSTAAKLSLPGRLA
jgi:AcrR family transcriptional regulator